MIESNEISVDNNSWSDSGNTELIDNNNNLINNMNMHNNGFGDLVMLNDNDNGEASNINSNYVFKIFHKCI